MGIALLGIICMVLLGLPIFLIIKEGINQEIIKRNRRKHREEHDRKEQRRKERMKLR